MERRHENHNQCDCGNSPHSRTKVNPNNVIAEIEKYGMEEDKESSSDRQLSDCKCCLVLGSKRHR